MNYELTELANGLPLILSPTPETPRMALAVAFDGGTLRETIPGIAQIASRLLLKGTERRSAEALATELDARAIDLREIVLPDSELLLAVFLPRELPAVLDILQDIMLHSTFADFDKEIVKLAGEINASLDLPSEQASDLLTRTLFPDHPYGNTGTRMLESLDRLHRDDAHAWHAAGVNARQMNVTLVGDFAPSEIVPQLTDAFAGIPSGVPHPVSVPVTPITKDMLVTKARVDAQQAQVYQGWFAPEMKSEMRPAFALMNTILGGSGLSSRLFSELRDKRGLAYAVHSAFMPLRMIGEFLVTIGTSPENIARVRQGFAEEITRLQQEPITVEELQNAKGRLNGAYVMSHETTSQQCLDLAINHINGLPPDYTSQLLNRVQGVTIDQVQAAAQGVTSPSVTAIVARADALP